MSSCSSSSSSSFFGVLRSRELIGFRVRKRPHFGNLSSDSGGVVSIEHNGHPNPPLALSFCKTNTNSHLLSVADEDGYVSFYDTRRNLPSLATCREKAGEARVSEWVAHYNAIFDLCWIKDDTQIMTASGDQTIKVWDTERKECVGVLTGHTGSVKSLSSHPSNPDVSVSGSRDGSFALWDLRCKSQTGSSLLPTATVTGAHTVSQRKRVRRGKGASNSITSVLYLKDEITIVTAGAVDSDVKFWDTRNLKAPIFPASSHLKPSNEKERRVHGVSCLSQDSSGMFLSASCLDNKIYLYNVLQLDKGPISTYSGGLFESFYVKSAISPDAAHIVSGSSDGNAYIWQVNKPQAPPIVLKGHEGEVTAVNWCPSEVGKIATSSDDFTVRIWGIEKCSSFISTRSPSSIRRRVMAVPGMEGRRLFMDDLTNTINAASSSCPPKDISNDDHSPTKLIKVPEVSTPDSAKRMILSDAGLKDTLQIEKTPEDVLKSPSSVLNPPSSLKRTIRDYFAALS